jgi:hypothetical protein
MRERCCGFSGYYFCSLIYICVYRRVKQSLITKIIKKFASGTSYLLNGRLHVSVRTGQSSGLLMNQVINVAYIKQYLFEAVRIPEFRGSQISRQSALEGGKVVSTTHRLPLHLRKYSCYSVVLETAIVRPEILCQ